MAGATGEEPPSRLVWLGKWELPQEREARHIAGRLGKARCRAARACRGLRRAVAVAREQWKSGRITVQIPSPTLPPPQSAPDHLHTDQFGDFTNRRAALVLHDDVVAPRVCFL